ncbi:tetratricopeptide repeat protein [Sphingoaurantiacus capsulatus]|uniref:Tetratricopeptide repeat protein n=1 Tax=Sphingoaurantiacus capsulatus TaxID=1771310 RepID=A0ABV7XE87_9SPHN
MRQLKRFAVVALLLGGTAAQATILDSYRSGLHDYVQGRHAWSDDELGRASGYFAGALSHAPDDPVLLRRTFDLALAAGDQAMAMKLAPRIAKNERYDTTIALLQVADALQKKNWKGLDAARQQLSDAGFAGFAAPVIEAWTLEARGKTKAALAKLDPASQEGFAKAYLTEHRAHLLSADKQWDGAAALYETLLAGEGASVTRIRLAAATALQKAKRGDDARKVLEAGARDPVIAAALARFNAGEPLKGGVTAPRDGISELFARMAADLSRERPIPIALVLARLSTFLTPENGESWLVTGDVLARSGQYDAALTALDHIKPTDTIGSLARARRAGILLETDRAPQSVALLEAAAKVPEASLEDWSRLGEAYQRTERFADSAKAYDKALAMAKTDTPDLWTLYFSRGAAHERAGNWPQAEGDLRQALKLAPKEAAVLNYLGYALLDRGERLPEATTLIEQAVELRPDDGHIVDSLGWAHFVAGRYDKAVELLERAVADVPDDATINEHLGDAYWKVGRHVEARFRWKASLEGEPADDARKRVLAKLDYGLDRAALAARQP